ncbi:MAG: DUF1294 domain-containing protein [Candidatus Methanomethylophilus sp.]|nr:DUF1294 domain-containing protein [Methanomethylophilus sp.]MDD3233485.1 DUF1294 domain-containing protein [Methanomethylophilus sp.]MDD4668432.1 DUF1294 domain-containing protein [Methanomethylophilus sp.]
MTGAGLVLLAVYVLLNLIAFGAFGWDKHKAINNGWRTPEKTLLTLAFFGPWGAVLGMKAFHHKTRKLKFKVVYAFLLLHVIIIVLLAGGVIDISFDF